MRPYGLNRFICFEFPDVADIKEMGAAGHVGQIPGRSGDYHPYCRSGAKARTRRRWARKARAANKAACHEDD